MSYNRNIYYFVRGKFFKKIKYYFKEVIIKRRERWEILGKIKIGIERKI